MPDFSGFILRLKQEARRKPRNDGSGDSAGSGFQSAGEDPEKSILFNGFFYTLGKQAAKACQRNSRPRSGEFNQLRIQSNCPQYNAGHNITHQDPGGRQFCLVDQDLADQAECAAYQKCFDIVPVTALLIC